MKEQKTIGLSGKDKVLGELQFIAQTIGFDFGMKLEAGEPGKGSFFSWQDNKITIDPLHLQKNPTEVKEVVAHEGGHRAVSRLSFIPDEVWQEMGFSSLSNTVEDCRVNNWLGEKYEVVKSWQRAIYDKGATTKEAEIILSKMGYLPKFAQYLSEIVKFWNKEPFSRDLPEDVRDAIRQTIGFVQQAYQEYPSIFTDETEIDSKARDVYSINRSKIWPVYKKLLEKDMENETLCRMIKEHSEAQKKKEGSSKKDGPKKGQGENKKQQDTKTAPEKEEEQEEKQKGQKGKGKQENQKVKEERKDQQNQSGSNPKQGEGKNEEEINKALKQTRKEERRRKAGDKNQSDLQKIKDEVTSLVGGEKDPLDQLNPENLSKNLQRRWKNIHESLPSSEKERLKKQAQEALKEIEDVLNSKLRGQLRNPREQETHAEAEQRKAGEAETTLKERDFEQELARIRIRLEQEQKKPKSIYEEYYQELLPLIGRTVEELERILEPNRNLRFKSGYPDGSKIDLIKAMQFQADPSNYDQLWQRKNLPQRRDYRFYFLVDLSSTMQQAQKIQETVKGTILFNEVFRRISIPYEIAGFSTDQEGKPFFWVYKGFNSEVTQQTKDWIGEMLSHGQGWTPASYATSMAIEKIQQNSGKENFLITLTDGLPQMPDDEKEDTTEEARTREVLQKARDNREIKLIAIKLGNDPQGDKFLQKNYPSCLILSQAYQLSGTLAKLIENIIKNPERY